MLLSDHTPIPPQFGVFPLHQIAHVGVSPSRGLKLFGREIIFEEFIIIIIIIMNVIVPYLQQLGR